MLADFHQPMKLLGDVTYEVHTVCYFIQPARTFHFHTKFGIFYIAGCSECSYPSRDHRKVFNERLEIKRFPEGPALIDRKSTRLNSSHVRISYAVFCLKKK